MKGSYENFLRQYRDLKKNEWLSCSRCVLEGKGPQIISPGSEYGTVQCDNHGVRSYEEFVQDNYELLDKKKANADAHRERPHRDGSAFDETLTGPRCGGAVC